MPDKYDASVTCSRFHLDHSFIRGLMGPIGSGKSVACCIELMMRASSHPPHKDGVRRSRWAIIRNTYRELHDTTLRTWFEWIPKNTGLWKAGDMEFYFRAGDIEASFLFRALDRPDDIKKLLSLELTGAWVNEAREVPKAVLDMLQGRVGRYPPLRDVGDYWSGIIMDTNPPDTDHWWYRLFEEERPEGWRLFRQPGGLSPEAENLANLHGDYYHRIMHGHDQAWIDVYVHGNYGYVRDGKPVYPEYADPVHCLEEAPDLIKGRNGAPMHIYVGLDFGLTPAAVFAQQTPKGQWQMLSEVVTDDMGAVRFADTVATHMRERYPHAKFSVYGDPAGEQRSQVDERTPFMIMRNAGIPAIPASSNDPIVRREAVAKALTTLTLDGSPRLVISPECRQLRKALAGGYKYRRLQVSGDERYMDVPDKNRYSHVADAQQYLMLGAGEGTAVLVGNKDYTRFKARPAIRLRRPAYG